MMWDGWVRWAGWGLACLAVVGLAGCQGRDEPTTTPTPSPSRSASVSLSPSASPSGSVDEQALIDEAVAALTEYLALANEVENNGGHGWEEKLKPWWGSEELVESAAKHFTTLVDAGWRSDGSSEIVEISGSVSDPIEGRVTLTYCLDATAVRVLDSSDVEVAEVPPHPIEAEAENDLTRETGRLLGTNNYRDREC